MFLRRCQGEITGVIGLTVRQDDPVQHHYRYHVRRAGSVVLAGMISAVCCRRLAPRGLARSFQNIELLTDDHLENASGCTPAAAALSAQPSSSWHLRVSG
jgi:hypothetical protein